MSKLKKYTLLPTVLLLCCVPAFASTDIEKSVKHGYASNNGVKIHYATLGKGPLVVLIHGFPDFWYTWRGQMLALSKNYQVAAMDLRGYNLSDKPKGVENYDMNLLVEDVAAVVRHLGRDKAVIVGHDWGGIIAWMFAINKPEMTEKLIVLNLPHPRGLNREFVNNPQQRQNSAYARRFQQEGAEKDLTAEGLTFWITDPKMKVKYVEAFRRSDFTAMLNYYRRNYPREPYVLDTSPVVKVKAPVLLIHGLKDDALLPDALNGTWNWVERELTIITIPQAGHFVQQDASEIVTRTIKRWLVD